MEFDISEESERATIVLRGEIDLECSPRVRELLLDLTARAVEVVVDLSAVSLIDSSGVASLLEAFQSAKKRGNRMVLSNVSDAVLRVLQLANLDIVFEISDDV